MKLLNIFIKYYEVGLFIVLNFLFFIKYFQIDNNKLMDTGIFSELIVIILMLLAFSINKKVALLYFLFGLFAFLMSHTLLIVLSSILIFYISYYISLKYTDVIKTILITILIINSLIMLIEINALIQLFYQYKIFHIPIDENVILYQLPLFVENTKFYIFQLRPSGLSNSTIFFSMEMMMIFAIMFYTYINTYTALFMVFISIFSGSTSLSLGFLILLLLSRRVKNNMNIFKGIILFIIWYCIYTFLYPAFSEYNYNYNNYLVSFMSRLDIDTKNSVFSAYTDEFFILLIPLSFMILSYYCVKSFLFNIRYLYIIVTVLSMFLMHNFIFTIKFYMYLGLLFGFINIYYKNKAIRIIK